MRIALLVTDLTPPRIGGISKVATELALNLSEKGHEVEVFCLQRTAKLHQHKPYKVHPISPAWMLYREYPVLSFSLTAFKTLLSRHHEKAFDVSHAMNFNNYGLTFWRGKMTKVGLAHVSTGFETTQMEIAAKWTEFKTRPTMHSLAQIIMECYLAPWQRSYLGWAEVITTEDIETKEGLKKMGLDEDKIMLIPSGIDLKTIQATKTITELPSPWIDGERVWLCPGRVDTRKGSQYLLRAFAKMCSVDEQLRLVFAGGGRGDYIESMKSMVVELGLEKKVLLTGRVDDLYPYYDHCEAVIIPSLSEGIPITLQEGLAFKKNILCSKLKGTFHYAQHLKSVIWAEPAQVDSLIAGLCKLEAKSLSSESIEDSFRFIEKADWSVVADAYLEAYQRAAELMKSLISS